MFVLFSLVFCDESLVRQLSSQSFEKLVTKRKRNEVWIVMFSGATCPACKLAYPEFDSASRMAAGMINFGIVDTGRSPDLGREFGIRMIPTFRIFYGDGDTEYSGDRRARSFVNQAAQFINDLSEPVDKTWKDSMLGRPSAILFTDKGKTPAIWAGLSAFYYGKSIRFGVSKKDKEMQKLFDVDEVPKIVFSNGTDTKFYDGGVNFKELKEAVDAFFARRLQETEASDEIDTTNEFEAQCLGGRQNCVVCIVSDVTQEIQHLQKLFARSKLRWFVGKEAPYSFMKEGSAWIYNPRKDGFIHTDTISNLETELERMLNGGAEWINRVDLIKQQDL